MSYRCLFVSTEYERKGGCITQILQVSFREGHFISLGPSFTFRHPLRVSLQREGKMLKGKENALINLAFVRNQAQTY